MGNFLLSLIRREGLVEWNGANYGFIFPTDLLVNEGGVP